VRRHRHGVDARAIHSDPADQNGLVSVNCAAVAPSLISSELLATKKARSPVHAAPTGPFRVGRIRTIFLDEVGETPADVQVALLRVAAKSGIRAGRGTYPSGGFRVIAATNRNFEAAKANGTIRSTSFTGVNVFPIEVRRFGRRKDMF